MSYLSNNYPSDEEIIFGLLSGINHKIRFETLLFNKYKSLINDGVRKHKLVNDECVSIYSDTIIAVINNIHKGHFEGRAELKTYVYQIFSNKCVDQIRKNTTNKANINNTFELSNDWPLADESKTIIQKLIIENEVELLYHKLALLGEKCREIILFWGEGYSDHEIAKSLGYNSSAVAKTSRLRCLEKLRMKL